MSPFGSYSGKQFLLSWIYCSSHEGVGQEVSSIGKPPRLFCDFSFPAISRNAMINRDATKKVLRSASRISLPINEMGVAGE